MSEIELLSLRIRSSFQDCSLIHLFMTLNFWRFYKMNKIKFICFSILFGSIIYSGFGIYQTLETIQSNYLQTLSTYQNEN